MIKINFPFIQLYIIKINSRLLYLNGCFFFFFKHYLNDKIIALYIDKIFFRNYIFINFFMLKVTNC